MNSNVPRPLWWILIQFQIRKEEIHLTCDECRILLEFDADLLSMGIQPSEIKSVIHQHLKACSDCRLEFADRTEKMEDNAI